MRLVRQGGSSNPKGGANKKRGRSGEVSGRRGLERPPIEREFGSRYIRKKM
jgi:hypothetical protein